MLLEKLAAGRSLEGALITIDAIACNPQIAQSVRDVGADYLLAVKGNQPTLKTELGEPPQDVAAKFDEVRRRAAKAGRNVTLGVRLHLIVRETTAAAWTAANRLIEKLDDATIARPRTSGMCGRISILQVISEDSTNAARAYQGL